MTANQRDLQIRRLSIVGIVVAGLVIGGLLALRAMSPRPAESPSETANSIQSPDAGTLSRWQVILPAQYGGSLGFAGADASFYIASDGELAALDPQGTGREGFPIKIPVDVPVTKIVFGPQGRIWVAGNTKLAVLDAGQPRPVWTATVSPVGFDGPFQLPDGDVLVVGRTNTGNSNIMVLDPDGALVPGWQQTVRGQLVGTPAIGPDKSVAMALNDPASGRNSILLISPVGTQRLGSPIDGWDGVTLSAQGEVIVWSYALETSSSATKTVKETIIATVESDGKPRPGWPIKVPGPASAPVPGPDGTLYLSRGDGVAGTPGSVVAFDGNGQPKPGWPVSLPMGAMGLSAAVQPQDPALVQPPTVAADGTIYVAATTPTDSLVTAIDPTGSAIPGFPFVLPRGQQFADLVSGVPGRPPTGLLLGKTGLLFLAIRQNGQDTILALRPDGGLPAGWPVRAPRESLLARWSPVDDGGLEAQFESTTPTTIVVRYSPTVLR